MQSDVSEFVLVEAFVWPSIKHLVNRVAILYPSRRFCELSAVCESPTKLCHIGTVL